MEPTTIAIAAVNNTQPISSNTNRPRRKRKIVVILGPTGAGKSRLSIDLASRFFGEIINSDKIQVYSGLNITTNKITLQEQMGIPHHLLGSIDPTRPVFTPSDFRKHALDIISDIKGRRRLPFIVGGSNSLIHALVSKRFDPKVDIFTQPDPEPDPELRYDCCFIWVDVCLPVLNSYLSKRVDEMLDSGMFEELTDFFGSGDYKKVNRSGLGQAIGVPEFAEYFEKYPSRLQNEKMDTGLGSDIGHDIEMERMLLYNEAVRKIKDNTCQLAKKQVSKILRLRDIGYDLKRIDATEAFRTALMTSECGGGGGTRLAEIWENHVVEPSIKIVMQFLDE
uniref:adenylate isopentenyltransferase-like n=1 Tax=Erigeron canadensis TaxID=72917 RepID=UPI001CB918F2|nr:adenylate isopentenyltransferase-like [Erigeron canadensis]